IPTQLMQKFTVTTKLPRAAPSFALFAKDGSSCLHDLFAFLQQLIPQRTSPAGRGIITGTGRLAAYASRIIAAAYNFAACQTPARASTTIVAESVAIFPNRFIVGLATFAQSGAAHSKNVGAGGWEVGMGMTIAHLIVRAIIAGSYANRNSQQSGLLKRFVDLG